MMLFENNLFAFHLLYLFILCLLPLCHLLAIIAVVKENIFFLIVLVADSVS